MAREDLADCFYGPPDADVHMAEKLRLQGVVRSGLDEEAYRLVREKGIPFREAYREVAKRYAAS